MDRPIGTKSATMPWEHYEVPVYWTLPYDGDKFTCRECGERLDHTNVILTQVPIDDARQCLCLDCVDPDWVKRAFNLGELR